MCHRGPPNFRICPSTVVLVICCSPAVVVYFEAPLAVVSAAVVVVVVTVGDVVVTDVAVIAAAKVPWWQDCGKKTAVRDDQCTWREKRMRGKEHRVVVNYMGQRRT